MISEPLQGDSAGVPLCGFLAREGLRGVAEGLDALGDADGADEAGV